jgi:hypothetical protein
MHEVHLIWLILVILFVLIALGWTAISSLSPPPRP